MTALPAGWAPGPYPDSYRRTRRGTVLEIYDLYDALEDARLVLELLDHLEAERDAQAADKCAPTRGTP